MTGCTYCGTPGCEWETCPERLEDRHGVPSDYDDEGQLKTDGGSQYPECPVCETSESVVEAPDAGYWLCQGCGERGSGPAEDPNWWRNDPDSIWYVEDDDLEVRTDGGTRRDVTEQLVHTPRTHTNDNITVGAQIGNAKIYPQVHIDFQFVNFFPAIWATSHCYWNRNRVLVKSWYPQRAAKIIRCVDTGTEHSVSPSENSTRTEGGESDR